MKYDISIRRTERSSIGELDFDNIPFGRVFADHIFIADYRNGEWQDLRIVPCDKISVHPGMMAWHYGQAIFEGMKASKGGDGTPFLFRPEMHAKRFNNSARRMCMPEVPEELFLTALHSLVSLDQDWIPPHEGSALYIRPLMIATDEFIGVKPSETYKFMIMCLPVGPYYSRPVSLKVEEEYVRAAPGGVGEAKTAGNYAAALYPTLLANKKGYDQVMWMDAREFKYVQEVGTMNIFFVIDGTVVTPEAGGTILRGITRDSIITILKDKGYKVEERPLSIDEITASHKDGKLTEVFGSGTAAIVANVSHIGFRGEDYHFDPGNWIVSSMVKKEINGIRSGAIADKFNWIVPVKSPVSVA